MPPDIAAASRPSYAARAMLQRHAAVFFFTCYAAVVLLFRFYRRALFAAEALSAAATLLFFACVRLLPIPDSLIFHVFFVFHTTMLAFTPQLRLPLCHAFAAAAVAVFRFCHA